MGQFEKGHAKVGGGKRGRAKYSAETRSLLQDIASGELEEFKERFANLEDEKYVKYYLDIVKIVLPQLQSIPVDDKATDSNAVAEFVRNLIAPKR